MNHLTTIKPKTQLPANFTQKLHQIADTAKPAPKEFKYLPDSTLEKHMVKIHDYIFATTVDEHGRNACKEAAKGFAYTIPHIDRYAMDMKRCEIKEHDLKRHYRDVWEQLPEKYRNKIRRVARRYNDQVNATIKQLQDFVDHHSKHLNTLDDEQVEQVLDLEPNEVEATLSTDLRTYVKPIQPKEGYDLTCKTIAINLAQYSKGLIYLTPAEVAKELDRRGFTKGGRGYYVELVK